MSDRIVIKGARLHNLKNVSIEIPKNRLVAFTGVSGSGKSTLVFDTLHKEAQRQYMEALGMVTHAGTPPLDSISGLSPSVSIDQHLTNRSPRSTVGTVTEVYTYLRVLFARLGHRPCPHCGRDIPPPHDLDSDELEASVVESAPGDTEDEIEWMSCPHCAHAVPRLDMGYFSFNKPAGACPTCTGLGVVHEPNLDAIVDPDRSILDGAVYGWDSFFIQRNSGSMVAAGQHYGFPFDPALPTREMGPVQRDLLLYGVNSPRFQRHFPGIKAPDTVPKGNFEGVVTNLLRRHAQHAQDADYREKMGHLMRQRTCPDCDGTRLSASARQVTVAGQNIVGVSRASLSSLGAWVKNLHAVLTPQEGSIAESIVADLSKRIGRLLDVGVGYLTLDRASPTLSPGEAQRLRLAALLGSSLTGVLYVLDEPTIGLHPRDTARLIQVLAQLRDLGNSVLVIEHDLEVLAAADYLVDFGPGGGRDGGQVVAAGPPAAVAASAESVTGGYLAGRLVTPAPARRRAGNGHHLVIRGAREHNLKNVTIRLPLGLFVAVTGVSGSGKSSLMLDILDPAARAHFYGAGNMVGEHEAIEGWPHLDKVITIDQSAIGRTPRSNAATYSDAFTPIRQAFAATPEARAQGLTARHFSFNVPGGRCERCEGAGVLTVQMQVLPDVQVRCPVCHGHRFKREVLAVSYRGHNIAQVLDLTIEEALPLFEDVPAAAVRLSLMAEAGLGYLKLGQAATTLSGGEAQRVKLAKELGRRATGRTLYLLDEPTTGLHPADTARLLDVLHRLVDAGNTVVVIEHNLDVIKAADWVIDLGPEGGEAGGQIVAQGTPEQVAGVEASVTGAFLRRVRYSISPSS
ncbi:MAG: excinuclease ABC subunit UvrA [Anaerolineae bacterium]|nr:excinuclease ABC subunit UvrA [Anaerolineae bacterium]